MIDTLLRCLIASRKQSTVAIKNICPPPIKNIYIADTCGSPAWWTRAWRRRGTSCPSCRPPRGRGRWPGSRATPAPRCCRPARWRTTACSSAARCTTRAAAACTRTPTKEKEFARLYPAQSDARRHCHPTIPEFTATKCLLNVFKREFGEKYGKSVILFSEFKINLSFQVFYMLSENTRWLTMWQFKYLFLHILIVCLFSSFSVSTLVDNESDNLETT